MPARKRVEASERREVPATLHLLPYFAYSCEEMPGVVGVGPTPEKALASMRSALRARYPFAQYDIVETVFDR